MLWALAGVLVILLVAGVVWYRTPPSEAPRAFTVRGTDVFQFQLQGPAVLHLPAPKRHAEWVGPVDMVTAHVTLPGVLHGATERLRLIVTQEDGGRRWENTFSALDQPRGMSISPALRQPSRVPPLTPELLAATEDTTEVGTTFDADLAFFDLPRGKGRYRVQAVLDTFVSNEIWIDIHQE